MNVTAQLELDSRETIKCTDIFQLNGKRIKGIFIESKLGLFGRGYIHETLLSDGGKIRNPIINYRELAESDENVKDVLDLIIYDFNSFVTFYKIIEILQKDDFKHIKKGGKYFSEVSRFNQSANSYKATGVKSRHHLDRNTPPDVSMSLLEAKSLMRMILLQWLAQKEYKRFSETES